MYYMDYFFLFSLLGHIIESFFYTSGDGGILYGPYTPVYGIGVCIVLFVTNIINKKNIKFKPFYIFLTGFIILSFIEYIGGILIEKIFKVVFWNYSSMKFHIGNYISLEMALIWGIASLVIAYLIKPFCDKWIKKIPKIITWVLIILFCIDILLTLFTKVFF